ncbi:hypothetical protein OUZ56_020523 [Daphnia magna]|uniref:Uncharacterized protein n=1 Tax=Daphnia magna TaxID=35525 RepID=A0ABQ9ZEN9_9CRUS|nr:hypothetical protein OUZ56_020523 [Daphnia magna]
MFPYGSGVTFIVGSERRVVVLSNCMFPGYRCLSGGRVSSVFRPVRGAAITSYRAVSLAVVVVCCGELLSAYRHGANMEHSSRSPHVHPISGMSCAKITNGIESVADPAMEALVCALDGISIPPVLSFVSSPQMPCFLVLRRGDVGGYGSNLAESTTDFFWGKAMLLKSRSERPSTLHILQSNYNEHDSTDWQNGIQVPSNSTYRLEVKSWKPQC